MVFHIQCAWCGKDMGTKRDAVDDNPMDESTHRFSHGICQSCKEKVLNDIRQNHEVQLEKKYENRVL